MSFDCNDDKSELARDVWLADELEEARKHNTRICFGCDERFAEDGIWFHDFEPLGEDIYVCPDCWLDFIWDNYITGCSFETFKELLKIALKD